MHGFAMYALKRLGMAILTILLVIMITFFTMHAIPASPFSSEKAKSLATIAALEAKYGFDKPLGIQFLNYVKNVMVFDFGLSTAWVGSTVFDLIKSGFYYSRDDQGSAPRCSRSYWASSWAPLPRSQEGDGPIKSCRW